MRIRCREAVDIDCERIADLPLEKAKEIAALLASMDPENWIHYKTAVDIAKIKEDTQYENQECNRTSGCTLQTRRHSN